MAIPDFSSVADAAAFASASAWGNAGANLAIQGAQAYNENSNALATMRLTISGMWANKLATVNPVSAISGMTILTGREANQIAESIALAQIAAKIGRTVPPIT